MTGSEPEITLAGQRLGHYRHICAFFDGTDEEHRLLDPFVREGLVQGERAFHIIDPAQRGDYARRLELADIDLDTALRTGQFELRTWEETYLREGHFDQDAMLALVQDVLDGGKRDGYPQTRLVAHMEWSLQDRPYIDDLIEYESRANFVLERHKDPVICLYDTAKFGGGVIMDILRTHPMAIVGGILRENPFFVPPDEFLQDLRRRSRGRG